MSLSFEIDEEMNPTIMPKYTHTIIDSLNLHSVFDGLVFHLLNHFQGSIFSRLQKHTKQCV